MVFLYLGRATHICSLPNYKSFTLFRNLALLQSLRLSACGHAQAGGSCRGSLKYSFFSCHCEERSAIPVIFDLFID